MTQNVKPINKEVALSIHTAAITRFGGLGGVHDELLVTMVGVANGSVSYEQLAEWIQLELMRAN